MASKEFTENRDIGLQYEKALERWMQQERRLYTLPTYDYTGLANDKAPRLMGASDRLIIPDLLVFGEAGARWCEVKYKDHADWNENRKRLVTGIPSHHWEQYQIVCRVTNIPVFLSFIHRKQNHVSLDSVEALSRKISHTYDGRKMGRNGMTFFCFDALNYLMPFSELDKYREAVR